MIDYLQYMWDPADVRCTFVNNILEASSCCSPAYWILVRPHFCHHGHIANSENLYQSCINMRKPVKTWEKWTKCQWAGCPHYCHTPCCSHIWCNKLSTMQWTTFIQLSSVTAVLLKSFRSGEFGNWVRYELLSLLYSRSSFVTNPRFLLLRPCARPVIWSPTNQPTATANLSPVCNGSGRSRSRGWQGLGKAGVPRCSIRLAKYPQPSCSSSDTCPPRSSDHHS